MTIQLNNPLKKKEPTQKRLLEIENYANYIGLICELEYEFINEYHEGILIEKEVKDRISQLMLVELKHINNHEIDLLYNSWIESIDTHVTDVILIRK